MDTSTWQLEMVFALLSQQQQSYGRKLRLSLPCRAKGSGLCA